MACKSSSCSSHQGISFGKPDLIRSNFWKTRLMKQKLKVVVIILTVVVLLLGPNYTRLIIISAFTENILFLFGIFNLLP